MFISFNRTPFGAEDEVTGDLSIAPNMDNESHVHGLLCFGGGKFSGGRYIRLELANLPAQFDLMLKGGEHLLKQELVRLHATWQEKQLVKRCWKRIKRMAYRQVITSPTKYQ